MHYFYCIGDASASKGWTIMYLIGGDGMSIFFCRNLFSRLKALYEFYFTSLRCISLLCAAMHDFYFFCRHCTGILFSNLPTTPSALQKENCPSVNSYVYDWAWTADCSLHFFWKQITCVFGNSDIY